MIGFVYLRWLNEERGWHLKNVIELKGEPSEVIYLSCIFVLPLLIEQTQSRKTISLIIYFYNLQSTHTAKFSV